MTDTQKDNSFLEAAKSHPLGVGFRPSFHALWHLQALGVIDDLETFEPNAWIDKKADSPVRVAVLDTPVAYDHPNLRGAIDVGLMRDFSVFDDGVFVVDTMDLQKEKDVEERQKLISKDSKLTSDLASAIHWELAEPTYRRQFAPKTFGTHGTAVSGLIGGRPARAKLCQPAFFGKRHEPLKETVIELPFCGINPFCRIVPVSLTAAPYASMVRGALEYALAIDAEVVVIAAAWAENNDRERDPDGWDEVDRLLVRLSENAEVLCAAGNQATKHLVYPASESGKDSGPWAVTACRADGTTLNYAPELDLGRRMIKTLSSEVDRYDREEELFDPWTKHDKDLEKPIGNPENYPVQEIISLDVPGPQGYNPSPYDHTPNGKYGEADEHYEIGSLYCRFSGTSAATAIAAGLISLSMQDDIPPDNTEEEQRLASVVAERPDVNQLRSSLLNATTAKQLFQR